MSIAEGVSSGAVLIAVFSSECERSMYILLSAVVTRVTQSRSNGVVLVGTLRLVEVRRKPPCGFGEVPTPKV